MATRKQELEDFKTKIPLNQFLQSQGYVLDQKASTKGSQAMKNASGQKVLITQRRGVWLVAIAEPDLKGMTIIDYLQKTENLNLGQIRQKLRPWLPGGSYIVSQSAKAKQLPKVEEVPKDPEKIRAEYNAMKPINGRHHYLETQRKIPRWVLSHPRFSDRIRIDKFNNAVFPHFGPDRLLCGFELKNKKFTSFSPGGVKGLWVSWTHPEDNKLIIGESAIDMLSYAALKNPSNARYVSISGAPSPDQLELLKSAMAKMPEGSDIYLGYDNDESGKILIEKTTALFEALDRQDVRIMESSPETAKDWNDILRASSAKIDHSPDQPALL